MKIKYSILLAALALFAIGCTEENLPSAGETAREYLKLWMDKYHPGISATPDGLYVLEETVGKGSLWTSEEAYSYLDVTVRKLDGTISSTTDMKLAQQLGTYSVGNYYGPKYLLTGEGNSYAGVDALLSGMRIGGTRTAVVPAWMLTTSRYSTQQEYLDAAASTSVSLIYTLSLKGQTNDVEATELDSLTRYVYSNYMQARPVSYIEDEDPDGTFFFLSNASQFESAGATKRGDTDSGTINYTGRLLNGQVFDTTVEKVAKDAGIYDSSKTYAPVSITFASEWDSVSMGESTSLINGFKGGLFLMQYPGEKAVVLFTSSHGYSSSGSGSTIPGWSPLIFELELVSVSSLE